jgi:hypothetical protein
MQGFGQDQNGCKPRESGLFNALEKLRARIGIFGWTREVVDENVGINKDFRVVWGVDRHMSGYES